MRSFIIRTSIPPTIIRVINLKRMRFARLVARIGQINASTKR